MQSHLVLVCLATSSRMKVLPSDAQLSRRCIQRRMYSVLLGIPARVITSSELLRIHRALLDQPGETFVPTSWHILHGIYAIHESTHGARSSNAFARTAAYSNEDKNTNFDRKAAPPSSRFFPLFEQAAVPQKQTLHPRLTFSLDAFDTESISRIHSTWQTAGKIGL